MSGNSGMNVLKGGVMWYAARKSPGNDVHYIGYNPGTLECSNGNWNERK